MSGERYDLADAEPFEIAKSAEETGGEFVRFEVSVHPSSTRQTGESPLSHPRWVPDNDDAHLHPNQEETLEVLVGELRVELEGTERTLTEGEEITLPSGVPHRHYNAADRPGRVAIEHRPARHSEEIFETFYAAAMAGKTDEEGMPHPLQFAVTMDTHPEHVYSADRPVGLQKALFKLLAPVGRLAGYEATYSRDDVDDLR